MPRSTPSPSTSSASGRLAAPAQIVVMAKYPSPGAVKTRLAARIGTEAACRLQAAFIADLDARLRGVDVPVTWAFWPPGAPFARLVPGRRCMAQVGSDLGERLESAMAGCLAETAAPVLALGADTPHLDLARVREAAVALHESADVVLGPATDGGYYLIGLRARTPSLFRDIAWGTPGVYEATVGRVHAAGLRLRVLPATFDVDDTAGLDALRELLAGGGVHLPHTATVLASLDT